MDPKLQPEIISTDIGKPSSSTTNHPTIHNLSFFDQLSPPFYLPILLVYKTCTNGDFDHHKYSSVLKISLSSVLSEFYPLAGRINGDSTVDCNDKGVLFLEARMKCNLCEILKNPDFEILKVLSPSGMCYKESTPTGGVAVQVTYFRCGGMSIGLCLCHKMLDMASMGFFINKWASTAQKTDLKINPEFTIGSLYPPLDYPNLNQKHVTAPEVSNWISKRLVFDGSKMATLMTIAADHVPNPTRVEVVTALIHKLATSAVSKASSPGSSKPSIMYHTMNLRSRMSPPVSSQNVGNLVGMFMIPTKEDKEADLVQLVKEFREAKARFSDSIAKTSNPEDVCGIILESMMSLWKCASDENQEVYIYTSWCSFGIYEADFGWGKPLWATGLLRKLKNAICLMDTREGDGIEVAISLEEEVCDFFEKELASFWNINPSVLE